MNKNQMDTTNKPVKTIQSLALEHGGRMKLDLSRPEHKAAYYRRLGVTDETGKEKLREKYPALCQAIENFSLPQQETKNEGDDYTDMYRLYTAQKNSAQESNGAQESSSSIVSEAAASTLKQKSLIEVNLEVYNDKIDPDHKYPVFVDSDYESDTRELFSKFATKDFIIEEETPFTVIASYTAIDEEGNLEYPLCEPQHITLSGKPIVDKIEVYHPMRIYSSTPGLCIVCYNRTAAPQDKADYSYQNVIINQNDSDQKLSVHLPFAGYIRLSSDLHFDRLDSSQTEIKISIDGPDHTPCGECSYPDKSVFEKVFQIKNNVLYWNFKEDRPCPTNLAHSEGLAGGYDYENWNNVLLARRVTNNVTVSFYAKIVFTAYKNEKEKAFPVPVVIESRSSYQKGSTKEIDHICLWWGCLAGHTKIQTADRTWKPICEIRHGSRVRLSDGRETEVEAVLSGEEKNIVHIVTQNHELLASGMHPILTQRGLVRAKELNAGDQVATQEGYEYLQGAYVEEYEGSVYSLQLKEPGLLNADGIFCGDFDAQQSALDYERQPKEWKAYHPNPAADDLAMLLASRRPAKRSSVENMAAKPYYACRFEDEGESFAVLKLKGAGVSKEGAFSMEFWLNIQGESRELFSQETGMRILVDGNTLVIQADEAHVFTVKPEVPLHHAWNQIFLASDGRTLSVGVNGFEADCFDLDRPLIDPGCDLVIGRHFSGYMRRVVLYSQCLDASILRSRMFQNICSDDMEGLAAFLDGIGTDLEDIGPNGLNVVRRASCERVSCAGGFLPAKGHGAFLPDGSRVNPGGPGSFSVYIKCYILPYCSTKSVLWSNGKFGEMDAVLMYFDRERGGSASLKIEYGGAVYDTGVQIPDAAWQDLILSYDASSGRMAVYQDGRLAAEYFSVEPLGRQSGGSFCLGNGWGQTTDYPADALFTCAAVYAYPVSSQKAAQLYASQPFVLDPQLVALFGFENGNCREYISGQEVYAAEAENVVCSKVSGYPLLADHYWYDIEVDTSGYSPDAEKVFRLFAVYMKNVFALATDTANEEYTQAACWYIGNTMLDREEIARALSGSTEDETLFGVIREFHKEMETLLNLTYANHPYNRVKSRMADKMGINSVLASVGALVGAGEYALDFETESLEKTLEGMREVLAK